MYFVASEPRIWSNAMEQKLHSVFLILNRTTSVHAYIKLNARKRKELRKTEMVVWNSVHMINPTASGKKYKWICEIRDTCSMFKHNVVFTHIHWNRWKSTTHIREKNFAYAWTLFSWDIQSLTIWTMVVGSRNVKCFWFVEKKVFQRHFAHFFFLKPKHNDN